MRVLAIDPGYERLGVAILEKTDSQKETLLFSDCISTPKSLSHPERIKHIGCAVETIIKEYSPEYLAIETLFFSTNQKTALKVSEARGAILFIATKSNMSVLEFTPQEIKVAVTGYGKSDKSAVIKMVSRLITIEKTIKYDDEFDAIATGLTFYSHFKNKTALA